MLQSETEYIDARPHQPASTKSSCIARPDHTYGSFSTLAADRAQRSMSASTRSRPNLMTAQYVLRSSDEIPGSFALRRCWPPRASQAFEVRLKGPRSGEACKLVRSIPIRHHSSRRFSCSCPREGRQHNENHQNCLMRSPYRHRRDPAAWLRKAKLWQVQPD